MPTVSIDVPLEHEQLVRRVLALQEELTQLALTAPHGTVLDACEDAVVTRSGEIQIQMLQQAVARRIETAEKRGRRSASATAAASKKTADPKPANSSPPSASSRSLADTGSVDAVSPAGPTPSMTFWV